MLGQGLAWSTLLTNLLLAGVKIVGGIAFNSQAVLADGLHSISDAVGSGAVLYGRHLAATPPDEDHPYGHEKAESIAAFAVGALLGAAGLSVAVDAVERLVVGHLSRPAVGALVIAAAGMVVKEVLFRLSRSRSQDLESRALEANAVDSRADVWSSLAALLGVVAARAGWAWADPVMALAVAGLLLWAGLSILRGNLDDLVERHRGAIEKTVRQVVLGVEGVREMHGLRARGMGRYVLVDVKIGVDGDLSVTAGHEVARVVADAVHRASPTVREVLVHVNPAGRGNERP